MFKCEQDLYGLKKKKMVDKYQNLSNYNMRSAIIFKVLIIINDFTKIKIVLNRQNQILFTYGNR